MSDRKTSLIGLAVVVAGLLAGWWMWLDSTRYAVAPGGADGVHYLIDGKTGDVWLVNGGTRVLATDTRVPLR